MAHPLALIAVPTLGNRLATLAETLRSIACQDVDATIVVISPDLSAVRSMADDVGALWVADPGSQAAAINAGVAVAPPACRYVGWLNDDDILESGSLALTTSALERDSKAVLAYGACRYVNESGQELWVNRAGRWAPRILKWGPDLIPQPGMLVRASTWSQVGGVDETMRFAFDLDLLLRIQPLGGFVDVGQVVSSFRWHGDSLTVSDRTRSLDESEAAKRRALSPLGRRLAWMWEKPVRGATRLAAAEVGRRARRISTQLGS